MFHHIKNPVFLLHSIRQNRSVQVTMELYFAMAKGSKWIVQ